MIANCSKCGKKAVVNPQQKCFHCADVVGTKYFEKKKVMSRKAATIIVVLTGLLDVWFSYGLLDELKFQWLTRMIASAGLLFGIACIVKEKYSNRLMKAPLIDLICKIVIAVDIPRSISYGGIRTGGLLGQVIKDSYGAARRLSPFAELFRPIAAWIVLIILFTIACELSFKTYKNERYLVLNDILDKENALRKLEEIPNYKGSYYGQHKDEFYEKELENAIQLVEFADTTKAVKEELVAMLKSGEDELNPTNEVRNEYCKLVEECLIRVIPKDEKKNWVDEMGADIERTQLPINLPETALKWGTQKYVTKNLFDLRMRINAEVNSKWESYVGRYHGLKLQWWLNEFSKDLIGTSVGERGEQVVAQELESYKDQMIVIPNLRLEVEGNSIESDFVVVSPYGIHILEVKNLGSGGSYKLLIESDGRWSKVYGNRKETMDSPVHQNARHIVYMEKMLNKALGRSLDEYINIYGMVVIANNKVDITNQTNHIIKRYDDIIGTIRSYDKILKEEDMKRIANILTQNALPAKGYTMPNYFDFYVRAKLLIKEYKEWKEGTKELVSYAKSYQSEILDKK